MISFDNKKKVVYKELLNTYTDEYVAPLNLVELILRMIPTWKVRYSVNVSDIYRAPSRGGLANQLDGSRGNLWKWILTHDDNALRSYLVRSFGLLKRIYDADGQGDKAGFDTGHVQRWDTCAYLVLIIEKETSWDELLMFTRHQIFKLWKKSKYTRPWDAAIWEFLSLYHNYQNNKYLNNHDLYWGGLRPQIRSFPWAFAWSEAIDLIEKETGTTTPGHLIDSTAMTGLGYDAGEYFFNAPVVSDWDGGTRAFEGKPGRFIKSLEEERDAIYRWPYYSTSRYSTPKHETPFHRYWVFPYSMMMLKGLYPDAPKKWFLRTRDICDHILTLCGDEEFCLWVKSGSTKKVGYGPKKEPRKSHYLFSERSASWRKTHGENSYFMGPLYFFSSLGTKKQRLEMLRKWSVQNKTVNHTQEIDPSIIWCALELGGYGR